MSDAARSNETPRIETERLILRAFEESDASSVTFYADPDVMRYIPRGPWRSDDVEAGFLRMVENRHAQWQSVGFGLWAIVLKQTGAVIGHCGLQHIEGGDEVEVFYLLDKPYWNQGIATEAARAALRFASERGLTTVVALAYPENHASQRVMEKAGMSPAGRARHYGAELVKYVASLAGDGRAESEPEGRNERA
jgi:ribosomal-protein-alanine N-acetyltransferase